MPETSEQIHARILAAAGEEPRWGESATKPCGRCAAPDDLVIWKNERWVVTRGKAPTGLPLVLWLHPIQHMDLEDLDEEMAAEYGQLQVRLSRIMTGLENIGRVHTCRWGDGGAHLHTWFFARPDRFPLIRGSMAIEWDEMLPPGPEDVWRADWTEVARKLATHDGQDMV